MSEQNIDERTRLSIESSKEFSALHSILHADGDEALNLLNEIDNQYNRRNFVRVAFALIEGSVYGLKTWALKVPNHDFTTSEVMMLSELTYTIGENGRIIEKPAKIAARTNMIFAFSAISRAEKIENPLDTSVSGWDELSKATKIRDRLTHPKSAEMLEVTDAELQSVVTAYNFYLTSMMEVHKRILMDLEAKVAKFEALLKSHGIQYDE